MAVQMLPDLQNVKTNIYIYIYNTFYNNSFKSYFSYAFIELIVLNKLYLTKIFVM